jgi:hypothetical protein
MLPHYRILTRFHFPFLYYFPGFDKRNEKNRKNSETKRKSLRNETKRNETNNNNRI